MREHSQSAGNLFCWLLFRGSRSAGIASTFFFSPSGREAPKLCARCNGVDQPDTEWQADNNRNANKAFGAQAMTSMTP
eukprot:752009-Hanusia_phi.AAC.3